MKPTIIGIAGGTASGKTTIAKKLYEATKEYGNVSLIRMDDYYRRYPYIPVNNEGSKNFDHPDAYEIELLIKDLQKLQNGESIEKPIYDFVIQNRSDKTEIVNPGVVIMVEGIMTFVNEELRKCFDIKIFVDTPDDIRFIRRLKRDMVERKRTIDSIVNQYFGSVRPMHHAFVEPSKQYADIIIPEGGHNTVAMDILVTKMEQIIKNKDISK